MSSAPPADPAGLYDIYLRTYVLGRLGRELPNSSFLYRHAAPLTEPELLAIAVAAEDAGAGRAVVAKDELARRIEALSAAPAKPGDAIALVA